MLRTDRNGLSVLSNGEDTGVLVIKNQENDDKKMVTR